MYRRTNTLKNNLQRLIVVIKPQNHKVKNGDDKIKVFERIGKLKSKFEFGNRIGKSKSKIEFTNLHLTNGVCCDRLIVERKGGNQN